MFKCAWFCKGRLIEALFDEYFWRVSFCFDNGYNITVWKYAFL